MGMHRRPPECEPEGTHIRFLGLTYGASDSNLLFASDGETISIFPDGVLNFSAARSIMIGFEERLTEPLASKSEILTPVPSSW